MKLTEIENILAQLTSELKELKSEVQAIKSQLAALTTDTQPKKSSFPDSLKEKNI